MARAAGPWQHEAMRRPSSADSIRQADNDRVAALSPAERVDLALALGEESLELYRKGRDLDRREAALELERRRQARRRPSACLEALLA